MNVVLRFDRRAPEKLLAVLRASDLKIETRENALFLAKRPGLTLTAYASGKLLITGAQAEEYAQYLEHGTHGLALERASTPASALAPPPFRPRVGSDESGKGDYFGALVVCAVAVPDPETERILREKRTRDSKAIGDEEALLLGSYLAHRLPHEIVALPPARYNELYAKVGNLNKLLAWAHARAIEDLLAREPLAEVVVDQFTSGSALKDALLPRGRAAHVVELTHAESQDLAVAAASVIARAEFLRRLAEASAEWGVALPKGGGDATVAAGREFVRRHGRAALAEVAKLHFVNTDKIERRSG